jgi:hypothetical protein
MSPPLAHSSQQPIRTSIIQNEFFSAAFLIMFANSTVQVTGECRNLQFLRFVEQYQVEQSKEDEMGGTCKSMKVKRSLYVHSLGRKPFRKQIS